ncbi:MAG: GNAT family N-acetyltransferase [Pseudomonadota bacterium]
MTGSLTLRTLTGGHIAPVIDDLAGLRISVFRDWPYLYAGDRDYEAWYLERFSKAQDAVLIAAFDGEALVGASSGLPLDQEMDEFRAPFEAAGYDIVPIFYFGESVLLPAYRGQGIGHAFFDGREAHARRLERFARATFCRVVRDPQDPRAPAGYRPLDTFWRGRGYIPMSDVRTAFPWKEIGADQETEKAMEFWIRDLS